MKSFFADIQIISFWSKTMDYSKAFRPNYFHTHNSSLEDATKLKFAPLCSSCDALSDEIIICNYQFLVENHGL